MGNGDINTPDNEMLSVLDIARVVFGFNLLNSRDILDNYISQSRNFSLEIFQVEMPEIIQDDLLDLSDNFERLKKSCLVYVSASIFKSSKSVEIGRKTITISSFDDVFKKIDSLIDDSIACFLEMVDLDADQKDVMTFNELVRYLNFMLDKNLHNYTNKDRGIWKTNIYFQNPKEFLESEDVFNFLKEEKDNINKEVNVELLTGCLKLVWPWLREGKEEEKMPNDDVLMSDFSRLSREFLDLQSKVFARQEEVLCRIANIEEKLGIHFEMSNKIPDKTISPDDISSETQEEAEARRLMEAKIELSKLAGVPVDELTEDIRRRLVDDSIKRVESQGYSFYSIEELQEMEKNKTGVFHEDEESKRGHGIFRRLGSWWQ